MAGRIDSALSAAAFYLLAYLFMNFGAFIVAAQMERKLGTDEIAAFRGLGQIAPFPAIILALSLLSLAGIPPLAGFIAKIFLLSAAIDGGFAWLAVVAAINMVIALYYYISVIAQMYLKAPKESFTLSKSSGYQVALALSLAGTLLLGVVPGYFNEVISLVAGMVN